MKILCNVPKSGICPVCGEDERIEFETVDVNYENCFQRCKCTKCGTEFDEVFEYAGQKIIKK